MAAKAAKAVLLLFIFSMGLSQATATILVCGSFDMLFDAADVVVVGQVTAIEEDSERGKVAHLDVSETWKGAVESGRISFVAASRFLGDDTAANPNEEGLYLLKQRGPRDITRITCWGRGRYPFEKAGDDPIATRLTIRGLCGTAEPRPCSLATVREHVRASHGLPD